MVSHAEQELWAGNGRSCPRALLGRGGTGLHSDLRKYRFQHPELITAVTKLFYKERILRKNQFCLSVNSILNVNLCNGIFVVLLTFPVVCRNHTGDRKWLHDLCLI